MASLTERLKKNSTIDLTDTFGDVKIVQREPAPTFALPLNIALQGAIDGGISPGITMIAGPSRHFKTLLALVAAQAWLEKYPDAALLLYDSEWGAKKTYLESVGIDPKRVIHTPIKNVEDLKFDLHKQLNNLEKNDNVIVMIDSIGNLASKREADNAENQNSAADMTRAKEIKSLWRIVTPYFEELGIPCLVINHTYETMEMFSKTVVSGGQGNILAANDIIVVGRQKDKDTKSKDLKGYMFILTIEKSRTVREGRKIPLYVSFEGGIQSFASMLDICIEAGVATSLSGPWYGWTDLETGEVLEDKKFMRKDCADPKFWEEKFKDPNFGRRLEQHYRLDATSLIAKKQESMLDDLDAEPEA